MDNRMCDFDSCRRHSISSCSRLNAKIVLFPCARAKKWAPTHLLLSTYPVLLLYFTFHFQHARCSSLLQTLQLYAWIFKHSLLTVLARELGSHTLVNAVPQGRPQRVVHVRPVVWACKPRRPVHNLTASPWVIAYTLYAGVERPA